ncbi:hypothetical protein KUV65_10605 [Maritalea mobilis]|uniref:hypothetical protein n=1 Tax=Maritalea mobilis TaxID=483324 RepID=UPI001C94E47C|nr:hypothetical protein [Maritalea mobilis]MBY6201815.1 hypothetical protein [Maritalea mobilis]
MMMARPLAPLAHRIVLAMLALVASVTGLTAQTLAVQSGEHDGFSRLVVEIGPDRDWALTGDGRDYALTVTPAPEGFDTSAVFNLIQRDRLAEIDAGTSLNLSLACPCDVEAFRFRDRYVVIDIADPPDVPAPTRPATAGVLPDLADLLVEDVDLDLDPDMPEAAPTRPDIPHGVDDIDLEEAAQVMAAQLARAAAAGLLDASLGRPLADADPVAAGPSASPDDPDVPALVEDADQDMALVSPTAEAATERRGADAPGRDDDLEEDRPAEMLPLRAETAFDTDRRPAPSPALQRPPLACDGLTYEIRDWADGAGPDQGLGALRLGLFDERDRLVPEGAIALARHYLFYGFGAEAAFWLRQLDIPPEDLLIIAAMVDGADSPRFPVEADPMACSGSELFWRYLDGRIGPSLSDDQVGLVQRSHAALPAVLRDHLAPRLARRLQSDGHDSAARNVADAIVRGGRLPQDAVARLDLDLGVEPDSAQMRMILDDALEADGATPAETMSHALALARRTGTPPDQTRLVAAEALLRETPAGETSDALWREVVLAHAATGNLDESVELLLDAEVRSDEVRGEAILHLIASRLDAQDTAALAAVAHLFGSTWNVEGSEAGRVRMAAISHLRDAGLFQAAEALRGGQRSLILPAGPAPERSDDDLLSEAWSARDWPTLAEITDGPQRQLANRMMNLWPDDPRLRDGEERRGTAETDLQDLSLLVEDSRALRQLVSVLLRPGGD